MSLVLTGTLTLDCDDISCLLWCDTTGGYSASNLTGYGSPNPEISSIISVSFVIVDGNGDDWTYTDADYRPNSDGDSTICLQASDFVGGGSETIEFVAGATYTFFYNVSFSGSDYQVLKEFVFPCCGSAVVSNLATNFAVEENPLGASIVFADTTSNYGGDNPDYDDISSTTITFELSNGDTVVIDSFIPTAEENSITLQAADLGYTTQIPDQIMNVTYAVYVTGDCRVGYKNRGILLHGLTTECIASKIGSVLENDCSCDNENGDNVDYVMNLNFQLAALQITAYRNIGCIDGKIEALYKKCTGGCSSC